MQKHAAQANECSRMHAHVAQAGACSACKSMQGMHQMRLGDLVRDGRDVAPIVRASADFRLVEGRGGLSRWLSLAKPTWGLLRPLRGSQAISDLPLTPAA